jgi:uncharacterized protein
MGLSVRTSDDARRTLRVAGAFLEADPVRNNVILTLLQARAASPQPGRYWTVDDGGRTVGVVFQSPRDFTATITPMSEPALHAAVDHIVGEGVALPGVSGEAASAARFAGHWTERTRSAARPVSGQRIYEVDEVEGAGATGAMRAAGEADGDAAVKWFDAFQREVGEGPGDAATTARRRLAAGQLWLWDDEEPVALAGQSESAAGVVRIGPVYTPPERRNHGYASALVADLSSRIRAGGHRCILYTQLDNPTSNAIYRAIGYRAVAEVLRYDFATP